MTNNNILASLLLLCVSLALGACDGGISGSGAEVIVDSGVSGSELENCVEPCEEVTEDQMGTTAEAPDAVDVSFTNTIDVTLEPDAKVNIVNALSDNLEPFVVTNFGNTVNPLIGLPGRSFAQGSQGHLTLMPDTHDLDIVMATAYDEDINAPKITGVNPLSLSAGSATTIIVRGSSVLADAPITALPVSNSVSTNNANTIQFRIINAAAYFGAEGNIDVYINDASQAPTDGMPVLSNLDYATGSSGYAEVVAGSYNITITDVNSQFQRIQTFGPLTPSPGSSTTIVIRDSRAADAMQGVDTDIIFINDGDYNN